MCKGLKSIFDFATVQTLFRGRGRAKRQLEQVWLLVLEFIPSSELIITIGFLDHSLINCKDLGTSLLICVFSGLTFGKYYFPFHPMKEKFLNLETLCI